MYPRVSWTALDRFERCSMHQRLHIERKRKPIPVEHVLVGNAMHYGMAARIDMGIPVEVASLWEFQRRVYEDRPGWTRAELTEQRQRVVSGSAVVEEALEALGTRLRAEVHLVRAFQKPIAWAMDGYLDVLVGDAESVWDLKTGRWHADQLVFYDVLVEQMLGRRPGRVGILEPFGRGLVPVEVSEEHRVDMKARITAFVKRVAAEDWAFEGYSDACGRCSSKAFCSKWDRARSGSFGA